MDGSRLNPCLRSTGKSFWHFVNAEPSVAYNQRVFVILKNTARLTLFSPEGKAVSTHVLEENASVFFPAGMPYLFDNVGENAFFYICLGYDLTRDHHAAQSHEPVHLSHYRPDLLMDQVFYREGSQIDGQAFPMVFPKDPAACTLCQQIWEEYYCRRPYYEEKCSALLKELLIDALRRNQPEGADFTANQPLAAAILRYIDTRFQYPITVQDIAEALHYHPYYLSRVFAKVYGVTPHQYLTQCRMTKALSLLTNTDMPIGEVAVRCGFVNVSHFSAAIRKVTGHSPTVLRGKS